MLIIHIGARLFSGGTVGGGEQHPWASPTWWQEHPPVITTTVNPRHHPASPKCHFLRPVPNLGMPTNADPKREATSTLSKPQWLKAQGRHTWPRQPALAGLDGN